MKWIVFFNNGLVAGHFTCDNKERGFNNWLWVRKSFRDNYYVLPSNVCGQ